jgi:thiamine biosynthesis lipoprotein
MRCGSYVTLRTGLIAVALIAPLVATLPASEVATVRAPDERASGVETLVPIQHQRYVMGTMVEVVVYAEAKESGERAVEKAMNEIVRLDRVLSSFKPDSDLSTLNRDGGHGFVRVDPSLYDIVTQSVSWSRRTGGRFDVTIAPLMRTWTQAFETGLPPTAAQIEAARRCVGTEQIETAPPDRIRFRSACLEIDLGGIGKGYAVDRALEVLKAEGIDRALINAGGSSIGAIGTPPGKAGWPVRLGAPVGGRDVLLLRDASMSTSQQRSRSFARGAGSFGEIFDPRTGAPIAERNAVTVVTASGTAAEALTKALLMVAPTEAPTLLDAIPDVSAIWMSPAGELKAAYRESQLPLADSDSQ